jgi:hypothetical protein
MTRACGCSADTALMTMSMSLMRRRSASRPVAGSPASVAVVSWPGRAICCRFAATKGSVAQLPRSLVPAESEGRGYCLRPRDYAMSAWQTEAVGAQGDSWRVEADDEWLAGHRSQTMTRFRRRFSRVLTVGNAVSNAELGPFAGAPRNPPLRVATSRYSVIRHVVALYAHTSIGVMLEYCRVCGRPAQEAHHAIMVRSDGARVYLGAVRKCRSCAGDSWLFHSRMPSVVKARREAAKIVL